MQAGTLKTAAWSGTTSGKLISDRFSPQLCSPICFLFTQKTNPFYSTGNPSVVDNFLICCSDLCNVCHINCVGFSNHRYTYPASLKAGTAPAALTLRQLHKSIANANIAVRFLSSVLPSTSCSLIQLGTVTRRTTEMCMQQLKAFPAPMVL